jgi:hypothetical protein
MKLLKQKILKYSIYAMCWWFMPEILAIGKWRGSELVASASK